jgi:hypothetical protein
MWQEDNAVPAALQQYLTGSAFLPLENAGTSPSQNRAKIIIGRATVPQVQPSL